MEIYGIWREKVSRSSSLKLEWHKTFRKTWILKNNNAQMNAMRRTSATQTRSGKAFCSLPQNKGRNTDTQPQRLPRRALRRAF